MIKIVLKPLQGILIEGIGELTFGQSKASVENLLGKPSEHSNNVQSFYDNYEMRLDFDEKELSFIEFIYGPYPEKTALTLYGINPFNIGAGPLIELLNLKNNGEIDDSEAEYCYSFLNISVGVWRDATEKDLQESINEAKLIGKPQGTIDQLEIELESVKNFWTIGIGKIGYYDNL